MDGHSIWPTIYWSSKMWLVYGRIVRMTFALKYRQAFGVAKACERCRNFIDIFVSYRYMVWPVKNVFKMSYTLVMKI